MTTISYPTFGDGGFGIEKWAEFFEGFNGILNDYTGNSFNLTRIDASNTARIAPGQVRVGGYVLEVTANDDLVVSTSAATYYIWAMYDPTLNVALPGGAADPAGPCRLGISTGAPSTGGGKVYSLLYQIVRGASQALTAATVKDFRTWQGPTLHIPAGTTIPAELLTDPETAVTGFQYPVGARFVSGSSAEYTHIKSTSGLKWEATGVLPTRQIITSTSTWTRPVGAKWHRIQVQAGGGGGGGAATTAADEDSAGAGAQGGAYAESILSAAAVGASVSVTVGGAGSASAGGAGGNGGNSSFGSLVTASGGGGGTNSAASPSPISSSGAMPAQTMVGQLQIPGGGGGALIRLGGGQGGVGGTGGSSVLGRGGGGRGGTNAGEGGAGYGAGGGGAANTGGQTSKAGGPGTAGCVIVETYF